MILPASRTEAHPNTLESGNVGVTACSKAGRDGDAGSRAKNSYSVVHFALTNDNTKLQHYFKLFLIRKSTTFSCI